LAGPGTRARERLQTFRLVAARGPPGHCCKPFCCRGLRNRLQGMRLCADFPFCCTGCEVKINNLFTLPRDSPQVLPPRLSPPFEPPRKRPSRTGAAMRPFQPGTPFFSRTSGRRLFCLDRLLFLPLVRIPDAYRPIPASGEQRSVVLAVGEAQYVVGVPFERGLLRGLRHGPQFRGLVLAAGSQGLAGGGERQPGEALLVPGEPGFLLPVRRAQEADAGVAPPSARRAPSGEKATAVTTPTSPLKLARSFRFATSQTFTVPS
jgi:hypothetical protein